MKIKIIMHAAFEGMGTIADWAAARGHTLCLTHNYAGEMAPCPSTFDALILMGGPQSPRRMDKYPYLQDEITLVQETIAAGKRVLGVCLGAQLLGEAFGGVTESSPHKEVGFWDISLTEAGKKDPLLEGFPETFKVAHWHNDMIGVPAGGVVLAGSAGCPNQIVRFDDNAIGLQCHMEPTQIVMQGFIDKCANDLVPGEYIQPPEAILSEDYATLSKRMVFILDRFFASA